MAELDSAKRRDLKDSAFAYVDARGRRRLPIHDAAHVRNALSRFNQVIFESPEARDKARTRLLKAASRHGIVPVGFVEGQLRAGAESRLPSGAVTFLMLDIVDSSGLLQQLEDGYGRLLADLRRLVRASVQRAGGVEVDARGDEYFAVFRHASEAIDAALATRSAIASRAWPDGVAVRLRYGIHAGRPTVTESGYVGIAVHAVRRICSLAAPDQVLASHAAVTAATRPGRPHAFELVELGPHRLKGLAEAEHLFEVAVP